MSDNKKITTEEAKVIVEHWLRGDENLTLSERVFVLEKMVRRLLTNELVQKRKKKEG
jgi:hypothetical protein